MWVNSRIEQELKLTPIDFMQGVLDHYAGARVFEPADDRISRGRQPSISSKLEVLVAEYCAQLVRGENVYVCTKNKGSAESV